MLQKIFQTIFFILIISLAALGQFSFILALPSFFASFNLLLIILVFTLFFYDFRSALFFALVGGLALDCLSFHFFGFYILILFSTAWLSEIVLRGWLTNRSLYSFGLLILLATLIYNIIASCLLYFFSETATSFFLWNSSFWHSLAYQSIWSLLAALLLFSLASAATRRFKPFFLEK